MSAFVDKIMIKIGHDLAPGQYFEKKTVVLYEIYRENW